MAKQQLKRGKFSGLELDYINLYLTSSPNRDMESCVSELSTKLGRSVKSVQKIVDKWSPVIEVEENVLEQPSMIEHVPDNVETRVRKLFARREGIAVMTPEAAEATDSIKQPTVNSRHEAAIFRQVKPDYSSGDRFTGGARY